MSETNQQTPNWWTTLPGTITAVATLLTAIGGILVVLNSNGCLKKESTATYQHDSLTFLDNFDNNINEWYLDEGINHSVRLASGKLYVSSHPPDSSLGMTSSYSNIHLKKYFPAYIISVECELLSEQARAPYGLILANDSYTEYYSANLYSDGTGNVWHAKNGLNHEISNLATLPNKKSTTLLTLKVVGGKYKYYIDNNFAATGNFDFHNITTVRLFASSGQTVTFDKLAIQIVK